MTGLVSAPIPDRRALAAIDLGAESCRVSLLRWMDGSPQIELIHRIPNGPVSVDGDLRWPLDRILAGIDAGLRKAAEAAPEGIRSIAVDGWAVDYVRLDSSGKPIAPPYCYRDERTSSAKAHADAVVAPEVLFAQTGAQPLRINTLYQLIADHIAGVDAAVPWLLLPEYLLHRFGGRRVAEYTNATHTGLVDLGTGDWSPELLRLFELDLAAAPPIVPAGTSLGKLAGDLAQLPAFRNTELIAPACHDTASAIAAIPSHTEDSAYIVSGTWSLVGAVVPQPIPTTEAFHSGFTNQGAAAGGYCFHTNVNGMWMLKQCLEHWCAQGRNVDLQTLIAESGNAGSYPGVFNVDEPSLLLAGEMPARINAELERCGRAPIADIPGNEALFARTIFESLAARYASVLNNLESLTGRRFQRIVFLGGGSRNELLRRLTETATGRTVIVGEAEGSTLGNFAVQLATQFCDPSDAEFSRQVTVWASRLANPTTLA